MSVQAIKAIDGIRFSVWSPTEIRKYSVVEVTAPETYDEDGNACSGRPYGRQTGYAGTWAKNVSHVGILLQDVRDILDT